VQYGALGSRAGIGGEAMRWSDYGWLDKAATLSFCLSMLGWILARLALEVERSAETIYIVLGLWYSPVMAWLACAWASAAKEDFSAVCSGIAFLTLLGLIFEGPSALFGGMVFVGLSWIARLFHKPANALLNIGRSEWAKRGR
jgi:hypothetical protein